MQNKNPKGSTRKRVAADGAYGLPQGRKALQGAGGWYRPAAGLTPAISRGELLYPKLLSLKRCHLQERQTT